MAKVSYDPMCEELARHFLGWAATDRALQSLAGEIQQSIEDWLAGIESERELRAPGFAGICKTCWGWRNVSCPDCAGATR